MLLKNGDVQESPNSHRDMFGYACSAFDSAGKERPTPPQLMSGDPDQMQSVVKKSGFQKPFESQIASWKEQLSTVTNRSVNAVMASFDSLFYAGLDPAEFLASVRFIHERVYGFDIHMYNARCHLTSGKYVAWFTPEDRELFNLWVKIQNIRFGWACPSDPFLWRELSFPPRWLDPIDSRIYSEIDAQVVAQIAADNIRSRDDIVRWFGANQFKVIRISIDAIFVQVAPDKILRFQGRKYCYGFRTDAVTDARIKAIENKADHAVTLSELEHRLAALAQRRAERMSRLYGNRKIVVKALTKGERISIANSEIKYHKAEYTELLIGTGSDAKKSTLANFTPVRDIVASAHALQRWSSRNDYYHEPIVNTELYRIASGIRRVAQDATQRCFEANRRTAKDVAARDCAVSANRRVFGEICRTVESLRIGTGEPSHEGRLRRVEACGDTQHGGYRTFYGRFSDHADAAKLNSFEEESVFDFGGRGYSSPSVGGPDL